jgi:hypothetical protein
MEIRQNPIKLFLSNITLRLELAQRSPESCALTLQRSEIGFRCVSGLAPSRDLIAEGLASTINEGFELVGEGVEGHTTPLFAPFTSPSPG